MAFSVTFKNNAGDPHVLVRSSISLKYSSILNEAFSLEKTSDSSTVALRSINFQNDYNGVSRQLKLYPTGTLEPLTSYTLTISGLQSVTSTVLGTEEVEFQTPIDIVPIVEPVPEPIYIEDNSIIQDLSIAEIIDWGDSGPGTSGFGVIESDPPDGSAYLESDYADGRITLKFSQPVAAVSESDFKVQRKRLQRLPGRWETVQTQITQQDDEVYVDLPSLDATPVYNTPGSFYLEDNFKYRVIISRNVSADGSTPTSLGSSTTINFAGLFTPMFLDPEELVGIFPEATALEISEYISLFSYELDALYPDGDLPLSAFEYLKASVACALSKIYDPTSGGDETYFMLGDLQVRQTNADKGGTITRGNATTWCEIAAVLRDDLMRGRTGMKAVVRGSRYPNPIPGRRLRSRDRGPR